MKILYLKKLAWSFLCVFICGCILIGININIGKTKASQAEVGTNVPIIMYHKVSKNSARWDTYTISPEEFESDLKYFKEQGYESVSMTDLINYVNNGDALPEKPIVITFDDGSSSDYLYVFPLLQEYETKAVISIIGSVTDEYSEENDPDTNYPHLLWDQIREMVESGYVEIQNHTYNLHNNVGVRLLQGESEIEYRIRLSCDLNQVQYSAYEEIGMKPNTVTYPYGYYNEKSETIIKELGFSASLICEERINKIYMGYPDSLYKLGRFLRPHGKSAKEIFKSLDL